MNKNAIFILPLLFLLLGSCNKKDKVFSCDPIAQQYAVEYMETNQNITRDSLSKLPFEFQFAVFRSLTNENKLRIYREKIDLVLSAVSDELSIQEKDALLLLRNGATEEIYDKELYPDVHPFIQNWENIVRNELGWSDTIIDLYVGTWNTPSELITMRFDTPSEAGIDCGCRSMWGCPGFGKCRDPFGCKKTNNGCGIAGGSKCLGTCPEVVLPSDGSTQQMVLITKYDF